MASDVPMTPELEQIDGEIQDIFRALQNGFQKMDKIKDSNRQAKQLEDLTGKMKECKRYARLTAFFSLTYATVKSFFFTFILTVLHWC
uniref:Uncharacterized protein n=1 Tax=Aegilops tauschii subsp. strangulata TaxID=200361 RepID=A0A453I038_AEGTS